MAAIRRAPPWLHLGFGNDASKTAVYDTSAAYRSRVGKPPPFFWRLPGEALDPFQVVGMVAGQLPVGEDPVDRGDRRRAVLAECASPLGRLEPGGDLVPVPEGASDITGNRVGEAPGPRRPLTSREIDWRLRPVRSAMSAIDTSSSSTLRGSKPSLIN